MKQSDFDDNLVVVDYETAEIAPDGTSIASTEAYRPAFRVISAAFTWRQNGELTSLFVQGEENVRRELINCGTARLVVHNLQFEMMVSRCRFPDLVLNWYADTMRLSQVYDNGGDKNAFEVVIDEDAILEPGDEPELKKVATSGFSLVKCAFRIMGDQLNHKHEAHSWIRANIPKSKGKEGQHLDKLPLDILERYNIADTEVTYRLYEFTTEFFKSIDYDWSMDHALYMSTAKYVVDAKIRGVRIDRELAKASRTQITKEVRDIEQAFLDFLASPIAALEDDRMKAWIAVPKTEKGQDKRRKRLLALDPKALKEVKFNPGSNKQLETIFVVKLGIQPKFFTAKGSPSFRSSMLSQWGEAGLMLQKRRKRSLIGTQLDALLRMSEFDGRWHLDLRLAAVATGRAAGGGGLNAQGLARKSPEIMRCFLPDEGGIVVSMDLGAGEPTVTTHYSGDKNYRHATLDGIGKRPYYAGDLLMIDDIYLMTMSVSPIGSKILRDFYSSRDFGTEWLADPDKIRKELKTQRQLHKIGCLGIGYGMQPRKIVKTLYENGFQVSNREAQGFYNAYWQTFSGVRALAEKLEKQIAVDGAMVNEFGYRLTPEKRKGFNYLIQSSVSGIVHIFTAKLFAIAPWAKFITCIHDEILAEVPIDRLEEFRQCKEAAVKSLNEDLKWSVDIRVGFQEGGTWYEAK